ncbi:MAG: S8 family peptidase, partial [Chloroflexi bacterium]|nr:S8 family peptidase [Chloroflexota bacterium]
MNARSPEVRIDPSGAEPEQVIVLETIGSIEDFYRAVDKVEGLEWLWEADAEISWSDVSGDDEGPDEARLPGRLYVILMNHQGVQQLLRLWETYQRAPDNPQFQHGWKKWGHLFRQLQNLRVWGAEDRLLNTGLLESWSERVAAGEETVRTEIELWFRRTADQRRSTAAVVERVIREGGGRIIAQSVIEGIHYHAILAELPISAVQPVLQAQDARVVQCDQVMFLRPTGQCAVVVQDEEPPDSVDCPDEPSLIPRPPVVAMLDGLPLENHVLLQGRLVVDDPDNWAATYISRDRTHGTAMASLIVRGELDAKEEPLSRPIYVRPILQPDLRQFQGLRREIIPENALPVDLVHRVVRNLFLGDGDHPGAAPDVRIINLSVGDPVRVFDQALSPWARLLDYLAVEYGVLFVVSAGNHNGDISLAVPRHESMALQLDPERLEAATLEAVIKDGLNRRLLSPAESINALTVGALHCDTSTGNPSAGLDPFQSDLLPSPVSAQGSGFGRAVKPDVLV